MLLLCYVQSRKIGYNLHRIEREMKNFEMNVLVMKAIFELSLNNWKITLKVQQFSMQILLEPIRFSILGFFYMDLDLLKSVTQQRCKKSLLFNNWFFR